MSSRSSIVKGKTVSAVLLAREGSVKGNSVMWLCILTLLNSQRKERGWRKKRKRKGEEGKAKGKEEEEEDRWTTIKEERPKILNRMLLHHFQWLLICSNSLKALSRFLLDSSDT